MASSSSSPMRQTTQAPPKLGLSLLHRHPQTSTISFPTRTNRNNLILNPCRSSSSSSSMTVPSSPKRKRTKYRKQYPGENVGITEEMRFVAMRLRNVNGKKLDPETDNEEEEEEDDGLEGETWSPSKEGFLSFLVDSKLVFDTIERIVDESEDVSYAYFRRTGLERCESLEKDLQWFRAQNLVIPEPSQVGVSYAKYLEEQASENAALFLSHFYSIYFSHIAGGQVLVKQVSEKLLEGKELEFNRWEGDAQDLLRGVREKLNVLGEHWTRDEKNKCLKETAKAFKYMGQIVRLIVL
ncbi:hypothetical protein EUTSA_v10008345mg [Eutrema salsugineum]|uniref:Uncharacterized protein n=1 Tax=Eutrema salsugineum TaxID=72664 RepID=V4KU31_EUTSA|nr:probable inactive heme oxygenase 2, chloroplastic [Eutrema salsugineum]ESQ33507.1 hypothetical protein EUTSA_v10008345mg [Eutrema salsugineum]